MRCLGDTCSSALLLVLRLAPLLVPRGMIYNDMFVGFENST
jgi:hypothetical protein